MATFNAGDKIELEGSGTVVIPADPNNPSEPALLGRGSIGEVYSVSYDGRPCIFKWIPNPDSSVGPGFRDVVLSLMGVGLEGFLLPLAVTKSYGDDGRTKGFGYITGMLPPGFVGVDRVVRKGGFRTVEDVMVAAMNLVNAFASLQAAGFALSSLSIGDVFVRPEDGMVMIGVDFIRPAGSIPMSYDLCMMPPEVTCDDAPVGPLSDNHVLAVELYRLMVHADPFMGAKTNISGPVTSSVMRRWYGTDPVFCWDPKDDSNRPVPDRDTNSVKMWPLLPESVRESFVKAFADGLRNPQERPTPEMWSKAIGDAVSAAFVCPKCGSWTFVDEGNVADGCISCCGSSYSIYKISMGKLCRYVPAVPGKKLRAFMTEDFAERDPSRVTGEFAEDSGNPGVVVLRRLDDRCSWAVDGEPLAVPVRVADAAAIRFGTATADGGETPVIAERVPPRE